METALQPKNANFDTSSLCSTRNFDKGFEINFVDTMYVSPHMQSRVAEKHLTKLAKNGMTVLFDCA